MATKRRVRPEVLKWRRENPRPFSGGAFTPGGEWDAAKASTLDAWLKRRRVFFRDLDRLYRDPSYRPIEEPALPPPVRRGPAPRYPIREVDQSAWLVGVRLDDVVTRTRPVTRRMACVVSAT